MSKLAHVLFDHEAKYLDEFLVFLKEADRELHISCTIFDGAIIVPSAPEKVKVIQSRIDEWDRRMPVKVAIKDWGVPWK
eukprot:4858300-Pyramimonas_sp.AAC.1